MEKCIAQFMMHTSEYIYYRFTAKCKLAANQTHINKVGDICVVPLKIAKTRTETEERYRERGHTNLIRESTK